MHSPDHRNAAGGRRRTLFTLAAPLLAAGVGLGALELMLRSAGLLSYPPSLLATDAERGWALRPGVHRPTRYMPEIRVNSRGLRGPEFAVPKPNGLFRILMLGDSITFGSGVTEAESLPSQLARVLDDLPVEVINAGVPGYNTYQEYVLLRDVGLAYEPDLVIVCFFQNDLEPYRPRTIDRFARARDTLREHVYLYTFTRQRLRRLWARRRPPIPADLARVPEEVWSRTRDDLYRIIALTQDQALAVAVVYVGIHFDATMHARLSAWCAEARIPYFDAHAAYEGHEPAALWVSLEDGHPNADGHHLAAVGIAEFLRATPACELPPASPEDIHV